MSRKIPGAVVREPVRWQWTAFDRLEPRALTALLRLRAEVFVLEQKCLYLDVDGLDEHAWHLMGWQREAGTEGTTDLLAAYLRVVFPGYKFAEPSIGRVVVSPASRGRQLGRALMEQGIVHTNRAFPNAPIRISAQQHLDPFYASFGFRRCSESYLEDGIPHIEMLRSLASANASPGAD